PTYQSTSSYPMPNKIEVTLTAVLAGITGQVGAIRSTDLGATWTTPLASTAAFIHTLFYDSLNHTLFAGSEFGIFSSTDDGATWNRPKTAIDSVTIYSFARSGNRLLAGSRFGVYKSSDNGLSWSLADGATAKVRFNSLLSVGGKVYAAVYGDVLQSDDGGSHWQKLDSGLPNNTPVNVLNSDGQNLYAGTEGYGIWKSPLKGLAVERDLGDERNSIAVMYSDGTPVLHYDLSSAGQVNLRIISEMGSILIERLLGTQASGANIVRLDERSIGMVTSGVAMVEIRSGSELLRAKVLLLK
ncbi:MAG: hypothetical protein ABI778_05965, partial [Ignavibacteriota bacterium]